MSDSRKLLVKMPDGSTWAVPVQAIIDNRLAFYRSEGKAEASDEHPHDYEIHDWAAGNMNWDDVEQVAVFFQARPALTPADMQEGWMNGEKEIIP